MKLSIGGTRVEVRIGILRRQDGPPRAGEASRSPANHLEIYRRGRLPDGALLSSIDMQFTLPQWEALRDLLRATIGPEATLDPANPLDQVHMIFEATERARERLP